MSRLQLLRATLLSALFLLAAGGWAASYFVPAGAYRFVDWGHTYVHDNSLWKNEFTGIELTGGALLVGTGWRSPETPNSSPAFVHSAGWRFGRVGRPLGANEPPPNLFRFGRTGTYAARATQPWVVRIPFWLLTLTTGVAFYVGALRPWRAAREAARAGLCRKCGYDLRASPGRCPECGATPAPGRAA